MQASDVMTTEVITIGPETLVRDIAKLLLEKHISGAPVIGADRRVLGIVSEGDLMRRVEGEAESKHSWWLEALSLTRDRQRDFVKSHGRTAKQVMTPNPITVETTAPVGEIARILEQNRIKRVPVVKDGRLVGIVSRANLLHSLAASAAEFAGPSASDRQLREDVTRKLAKDASIDTTMINVVVKDGVVHLWGVVLNETSQEAARVAAENVPGVTRVESQISQLPAWVFSV